MRLTADQATVIRASAVAAFGDDVEVRLFGSRTDDGARGGDIDLHVEVAKVDAGHEVRFRAMLRKLLDEPQVDVVVHERGTPLRWIDRAAHRDGISL